MKDGDPQQRNKLQAVMVSVFPKAREGACGYHIGKSSIQLHRSEFPLTDICSCVTVEDWLEDVPGVKSVSKIFESRWKSATYNIKQ